MFTITSDFEQAAARALVNNWIQQAGQYHSKVFNADMDQIGAITWKAQGPIRFENGTCILPFTVLHREHAGDELKDDVDYEYQTPELFVGEATVTWQLEPNGSAYPNIVMPEGFSKNIEFYGYQFRAGTEI